MLARTKTHPTENISKVHSVNPKQNWREFFEKELEVSNEQGLYLKGLRRREGYTQKDLGILIGTSQNNISAMERGRRTIGKDIAHKLAKVFKVSYQRFL